MKTNTRTKPPLQPATGTFRWLQKPDEKGDGGVLLINGTPYLLAPVRENGKVNKQRPVVGWRLVKADATVYDVRPGDPAWQCDCGDYTFHRDRAAVAELRTCKHCNALKKALPLAGLSVPAPVPIEPGEPLPDPEWTDGDPAAFDQP